MNIFDVLGPVMIGPSSSHTAGVVRIGNAAVQIVGKIPEKIVVQFAGSFATTYKGHGSDRAIIAGIMGYKTDDLRVKDALDIATEKGLSYTFETIVLPPSSHPNTIVLLLTVDGVEIEIVGESLGGGNFAITKVDGTEIFFTGRYDTLLIDHIDAPGIVAEIGMILAMNSINIAQMKLWRKLRGGDALMLLEVDQPINNKVISRILRIDQVSDVTFISGMM